jgi:glycosyltransferase involved in cell wall biosynthesis
MPLTELRKSVTLSVVIPAYNEAQNLRGAVVDVMMAGEQLDQLEVLVVNDGSSDGTGVVADALAREFPQVTAIHHPSNLGVAEAYRTGLARARLDYFTMLPGDNEVALESIRDIFSAIGSADLVIPYHATPWLRTWQRRAITWLCTSEVNLLLAVRLRYYQGPTVYPTALARRLPLANGFIFPTEMLIHAILAGYSWKQVGLTHQQRTYGQSKAVHPSNLLQGQKRLLELFWELRIRHRRVLPRVNRNPALDILEGTRL